MGPWVVLISVSKAFIQTPAYAVRLQNGYSASRGVHIYIPAFAGSKLYCLVTEAHGCEQLYQSSYLTAQRPEHEPAPMTLEPMYKQ